MGTIAPKILPQIRAKSAYQTDLSHHNGIQEWKPLDCSLCPVMLSLAKLCSQHQVITVRTSREISMSSGKIM